MSCIRNDAEHPLKIAVTTRLSPQQVTEVESLAREMGLSRSEFIRDSIKASLNIKKSA